MRRSEKKIKIKIEPEPKLCKIIKPFTSIDQFYRTYADQVEGEFWSKTSIIIHIIILLRLSFSWIFHKFLCKQQARRSFCSVSLTFPII